MVGYSVPMVGGSQQHYSMPVYAGSPRQMGAGIFGTLKRTALPILHRLLPFLKRVGKRAAKSALSVGHGVLQDIQSGNVKDIRANIRKRGRAELGELSREYLGHDVLDGGEEQQGSGKKRRRRRTKKSINKTTSKRKNKAKIGLDH